MAARHIIDVDITDRADGLVPTWDTATSTHIYSSAAGLPADKAWFTDNYHPDDYPASPNALDDEFEDSSIAVAWTTTNNPAGGNAISESKYPGYIWVGLPESVGTDNFDGLVRFHQTAPSGAAVATYIAKVAVTILTDGTAADNGEFCGVWVYLADSANDEMVGAGVQFNNGASTIRPLIANGMVSTAGTLTAASTSQALEGFVPGEFVYVRLDKVAATAYTGSQVYDLYLSSNGILWYRFGTQTKTFTANCDEVGIAFRLPKPAGAGTPQGEALVDFFRRTV
jgi:hypothetical protein